MVTQNIDFGYLLIQAFMYFEESYSKIRKRYKCFPVRLMECIDNGERWEHIRINFEEQGACVTFSFDRNRMPMYTCISFYKASSEDLFLSYVKRLTENYNDPAKRWFITDSFYISAEESCTGTGFYCFKQ